MPVGYLINLSWACAEKGLSIYCTEIIPEQVSKFKLCIVHVSMRRSQKYNGSNPLSYIPQNERLRLLGRLGNDTYVENRGAHENANARNREGASGRITTAPNL